MSQHHTQLISRIALTATALTIGVMSIPVAANAATTASSVAASPAAKTAPGQPKFGEQGAHVVAVQKAIMKNGFSLKGGATGVFNKTTLLALKSFQKVVGLKVTGVVDVATAKVLKVVAAPPASTTIAPSTTVAPPATVAPVNYPLTSALPVRGNKGNAVVLVQKALAAAGLAVKGGIDGSFGSGTTATLAAFQNLKGLPSTGLLDPATAAALGLIAPVSPTPAVIAPAAVSAAAVPTMTSTTLPSRGNRGDKVRAMQNALIAAGIEVKGGADGVFGGATFVALQKYQSANGLEVNGRLNPPTAIKLGLIAAPSVQISVFPVQGLCSYENTWHAPRGTNRLHLGVDILAKEGNLLYAVSDGKITKMYTAASDKLAGNGVRLTTADGTYFFYGHMQRVADGITIGTSVKAGQVLGYLGKTGGTTTPHLHLEVHPLGGEAIDPTPVVAAVDACRNTTPLAAPAA